MDDSTKQLIEQLEIIKAQIEWDFSMEYQLVLENAIKRIQMEDYMLHWLDEHIDIPCPTECVGVDVSEIIDDIDDYCADNCGDVKSIDCWKRFFMKKIGEDHEL